MAMTKDETTTEDKEATGTPYNVFRDSPVRFLGYANEVGESFRYQYPKFVGPSYGIAFCYCALDAATSGYNTWAEEGNTEQTTGRSKGVKAGLAAFDTLLWQCLASVTIPGATINAIVKTTRFAVARSPATLPLAVSKWLPTATGLSSIPFIVTPIDKSVDYLMDNSVRQWIKEEDSASNSKIQSPTP